MLKRIFVVLALCCPAVYAADPPSKGSGATGPGAPASEASIKQLLELAQAHKMVDSTMAQMDGFMKNMMQQATQGRKLTPEIQKEVDKSHAEAMAIMKETLDWSKLEPMYIRIYQKSLSQSEADGMIAFYKTPAGQAVITKMPVIMQNTLAEMQQLMSPMMQRMQQRQQEIAAKVKAESEKKG